MEHKDSEQWPMLSEQSPVASEQKLVDSGLYAREPGLWNGERLCASTVKLLAVPDSRQPITDN